MTSKICAFSTDNVLMLLSLTSIIIAALHDSLSTLPSQRCDKILQVIRLFVCVFSSSLDTCFQVLCAIILLELPVQFIFQTLCSSVTISFPLISCILYVLNSYFFIYFLYLPKCFLSYPFREFLFCQFSTQFTFPVPYDVYIPKVLCDVSPICPHQEETEGQEIHPRPKVFFLTLVSHTYSLCPW